MIKGIQVKCNMKYKDYLSYCLYPLRKKGIFKFFLIFSALCFAAVLTLVIINIINHTVTKSLLIPLLIFIGFYILVILYVFINTYSKYKKAKDSFNKYLVYSFLNNKMAISLPNKPDETIDIFCEKIICMEETKRKFFVVLNTSKYYIIDKYSFVEGNIADLRSWAVKHVKQIKMIGK